MPTNAALIDAYLAGVGTLADAVAGLTPEQLRARPVTGKWSVLEVLCHVADFEPVYCDRIRRTLAMPLPLLLPGDPGDYARALHYHDRDPAEEFRLVEATRTATARILRLVPDAAWDRAAIHAERGKVTVRDLVETITGHVPHHVRFIREKRAALGV